MSGASLGRPYPNRGRTERHRQDSWQCRADVPATLVPQRARSYDDFILPDHDSPREADAETPKFCTRGNSASGEPHGGIRRGGIRQYPSFAREATRPAVSRTLRIAADVSESARPTARLNQRPKSRTVANQPSPLIRNRSRIGAICSGIVPRLPARSWRSVQSSSDRYFAGSSGKYP
jgi:hypothetical protein